MENSIRFPRRNFTATPPPTDKLFLTDPYARTAKATVLDIYQDYVVLDKSIFYAESGGQVWDTGTIGDFDVVEVQDQGGRLLSARHPRVNVPSVKVETIIVHRLDRPPSFQVGDIVSLELDWERRYANMRQHSASHFLFHAAQQVYGADNPLFVKGCRIHPEGHRFDFADDLEADRIPEVEALANALIAEGLDIVMAPEPLTTEIQYWTYKEDIIIPCGGTHVKSANELGPLVVRRKRKGANLTRLTGVFA